MLYNTPTPHKIFFSIAVICLVGYAFFNSRFLLQGPEIVLANIDKSASSNIIRTDSKNLLLQGNIQHSSYITINNRPIMVDEAGNFNEKLLLSNGVSVIDIYARDKFGKEAREKIDVVYAAGNASPTIEYEKIALRAQEHSSSTVSKEEVQEEVSDVGSTTVVTTASSTVMTVPLSSEL